MMKLAIYDFDDTLVQSPKPEGDKEQWSKYYGKPYPALGWWGRPESLDFKVFSFNINPVVVAKLRDDYVDDNTYVVILTARLEKLRPQVEAILKLKNIPYDRLIMDRNGKLDKGQVIINFVKKFPDLKEIDVYDDMQGKISKLEEYTSIKNELPENIDYKIYFVEDGEFNLVDEMGNNKINKLINEEIIRYFKKMGLWKY